MNWGLSDQALHLTPRIAEANRASFLGKRMVEWGEWGSDQDNQLISSEILLKHPLDLGLYRPFLG
jgi:hypothetical protein